MLLSLTFANMTLPENWHGKPYYSLDAWCKNTYNYKCFKVALNAHMTCPNRDGSLDTRGCIFCSKGGSGDFAVSTDGLDIEEQLNKGFALIADKLPPEAADKPCIIAYFQAYTNTYAPLPYLRSVFTSALASPKVCGISIATRPDCLPEDVCALLAELKVQFPGKFIWVELGLQTINENTAQFIRRGYPLSCFEEAFARLRAIDIPVIVHTILGLPGETAEDAIAAVRYLNQFRPFGVKFQLLHVLKDTDLADYYLAGGFETLSKEAYLDMLIRCLAALSPDICVHRVTGDGPKDLLIAPDWSKNKRGVLNSLHQQMSEQHLLQGSQFM